MSQWIKPEQQMPVGDGVFTLCLWEGHIYVDCFYDGSDGEEPCWEERMPTHWMPLPAAPENHND